MQRLLIGFCVAFGLVATQADANGLVVQPLGEVELQGAELVVLPSGDDEEAPDPLPLRAGPVEAGIAPGAVVTCSGNAVWCPEVTVQQGHQVLPVLAATLRTGSIENWRSWPEVESGVVQGVVKDAERGTLEFTREMVVDEGSFAVKLPRAVLDLRFAFPDAAPEYVWGRDFRSEEAGRLRPFTLQAGASVTGWVEHAESGLPVPAAQVTAHPLGGSEPGGRRLETWTGESGENGFFQLRALAPGRYRLEVEAEGLLPTVLAEVQAEAASETPLGKIAVRPPSLLEVHLSPPTDPGGNGWTVVFDPIQPVPGEASAQAAVDAEGLAEIRGLRDGEYYVKVQGDDGGDLLVERVDVTSRDHLFLDVPVVVVEGRVFLGDEPVAGTVILQGGTGDRAELRSDGDGAFTGWMALPERPWLLATVRWEAGGQTRSRTMEVTPEIDDGKLSLDIRLPAGAIFGRVVDSLGSPRMGVRVRAIPERQSDRFSEVRTETDRSGRFHLTGLDRSVYHLQAGGDGGAASEIVTVDLGDDFPPSEVLLALQPTRPLEIGVYGEGRAVAGATVRLDGLRPAPVSLTRTTGPDGKFVVEVPQVATHAVVTVMSPSHPLWTSCQSLAAEELRLEIPTVPASSLRIESRNRDDAELETGRLALVTRNGGAVGFSTFLAWSRARNGTFSLHREDEEETLHLEVPRVMPGEYALVWTGEPPWEVAARACSGSWPEARWQTAPSGGSGLLTLDLAEKGAGL